MEQKKDGNYSRATIVSIVVACLLLALVLALAWSYVLPAYRQARPDVAFAEIGPMRIAAHGYAYRAVLAVQTGADDAEWAQTNKALLDEAVQRALSQSDPRSMRTPAGLASVQERLAERVNATLDRPRVQRVLFTDFVIQPDLD